MKYKVPQEFYESNLCNICGEEIGEKDKQIKMRIAISLINLCNFEVCDKCVDEKIKIPYARINFVRALVKFRSFNGIRNNDFDAWNKEAVEVFVKYLKSEKIDIKDYGIILCSDWKSGEEDSVKYNLLDLIKLYKLEDAHSEVSAQ